MKYLPIDNYFLNLIRRMQYLASFRMSEEDIKELERFYNYISRL